MSFFLRIFQKFREFSNIQPLKAVQQIKELFKEIDQLFQARLSSLLMKSARVFETAFGIITNMAQMIKKINRLGNYKLI